MAVALRVIAGGTDYRDDESDVTALAYMDETGNEAEQVLELATAIARLAQRRMRRAAEGRIEYTGLRRRATDWLPDGGAA